MVDLALSCNAEGVCRVVINKLGKIERIAKTNSALSFACA